MTDHKRHLHGLVSAFHNEPQITTPSEYDELRAQIRRHTTRLLAQLIDAQLDLAIPDNFVRSAVVIITVVVPSAISSDVMPDIPPEKAESKRD